MGKARLDDSFFRRERSADEAKRARKIENVYHVGQKKIWDGRDVLGDALERHGPPTDRLDLREQRAVSRVVGGLMWGELAAWRISAQLADRLVDLEARLAATSQVHDEARHFYVLHDYLATLDVPVPEADVPTRKLVETVLNADDLVHKLVGMQLFIESIALTIFKSLRERAVCPVLTELLTFFERDEARHVGFGVQYTPDLVRGFGPARQARLDLFQLAILKDALVLLRSMRPDLEVLGVDAREMAYFGRDRMLETVDMIAEANGRELRAIAGPTVKRVFEASIEMMFPPPNRRSLRARVGRSAKSLVQGQSVVAPSS